jgi:hypothetical protein
VLHRGTHLLPDGVGAHAQPMAAPDGQAPAAVQSASTEQDVGPLPSVEAVTTRSREVLPAPPALTALRVTVNVPLAA